MEAFGDMIDSGQLTQLSEDREIVLIDVAPDSTSITFHFVGSTLVYWTDFRIIADTFMSEQTNQP
jgi:hypothetical protein